MSVVGINCSPRKSQNTFTLLKKALDGALAKGYETELIQLSDLSFSGCKSCFACKRLGSSSFGSCAVRDALSPVLEKCVAAQALIIGTPIYFGDVSSLCREFTERLLFPNCTYGAPDCFIYPKRIPTGLIYTMNNASADVYRPALEILESFYEKYFGPVQSVCAVNTYQFDDYSAYSSEKFDERAKALYKKLHFPEDCKNAFSLGQQLTAMP